MATEARPLPGAAGLEGATIVIEGVPVTQGRVGHDVSERLMSVVAPVGVFVLWELAARVHLIDTRFFPAPSSIAGTFGTLIQNGSLPTNSWASRRICCHSQIELRSLIFDCYR